MVSLERFLDLRVGEMCRVEVVRIPMQESPSIRIVGGNAGIHAYSCDYLAALSTGGRGLPPELEPWFDPRRR